MYTTKGKVPCWYDWSHIAEEHPDMMAEIRAMKLRDLVALAKKTGGRFQIKLYDTQTAFDTAEALEYVTILGGSTVDNPQAICCPIGPVRQHQVIWRVVNELGINLRDGIVLPMDEFIMPDGTAIPRKHKLSFAGANLGGWINRIHKKLRPAPENVHHLTENFGPYVRVWNDPGVKVKTTQGGEGDTGHFAFDDPVPRDGKWAERPPTADEYAQFPTRIVPLHPWTTKQDARHSTNGDISLIPDMAVTVGAKEVLERSEHLSFWHPGYHAPSIVIWMSAYMIAKGIQDSRLPQSLFARHNNVTYHLLRPGIVPPGINVD